MPTFQIAVTGDTGYDIYTNFKSGFVSSDGRVQHAVGAYDLDVPSGASSLALLLKTLLMTDDNESIAVTPLLPKNAWNCRRKEQLFSTSPQFLLTLETAIAKPKEEKLRVKRIIPILRTNALEQQAAATVFDHLVNDEGKPASTDHIDLLVIHDSTGSWRNYDSNNPDHHSRQDALSAQRLITEVLEKRNAAGPRIIVNIDYDLPEVRTDIDSHESFFAPKLTLWNQLANQSSKVCVICSANLLRRDGAAISRHLSWEQSVEDLATDLRLFEPLKVLAQFKHIIIRFGLVAAVHVMRTAHRQYADLVFAPMAKSGNYRDPAEEGRNIGNNAFLMAALAHEIAKAPSRDKRDHKRTRQLFANAIASGLHCCMKSFDAGYKDVFTTAKRAKGTARKDEDEVKGLTLGDEIIRAVAKPAKAVLHPSDENTILTHEMPIGRLPIPCHIMERPPGVTGIPSEWQILRDALNQRIFDNDVAGQPILRANVGMAIVLYGHDRVLNRDWSNAGSTSDAASERIRDVLCYPDCRFDADELPDHSTLPSETMPSMPTNATMVFQPIPRQSLPALYVPVMQFGKLTVIEREEIESLRSIRNLMKHYIESHGKDVARKPIAIAVFGPPGSGKSFAIKEIAENIRESLPSKKDVFEVIEYNVAQFRTVEDLADVMTRVSSRNSIGKIPLVFLDEFDCSFQGQPLGWLKYFLAPMQDGTFHGGRQNIDIGSAILIFGGGLYATFDDFDPSSKPVGLNRDHSQSEEATKRTNEFRDRKGPDFISRLRGHINILPINGRDGETKPIIRRAIVLRGLCEKLKLMIHRDGNDVAAIDEDILYALLTTDRYRHGTRSMQAILEMCVPMNGQILKASLPSRAQLHMHVDADAFMIRMYRGRARRLQFYGCQEALSSREVEEPVVPAGKQPIRKRAKTGTRRVGPGHNYRVAKSAKSPKPKGANVPK